MDNDASSSLKKYIQQEGIRYLLVLPHIHRANEAEWSIKTWKYHFIAGLASTDTQFTNVSLVSPHPTSYNDLEYVKTLPTKSNYFDIHCNWGKFDFHKTPLALKYIYYCHVVTLLMSLAPAYQGCRWKVFTKRFILDFLLKRETFLIVLILTITILA